MSASLEVRPACAEDLPEILALERATAEAPHWTDANYRGYLGPGDLTPRCRALFVIRSDETLQGFAAATLVAEEAELESIAVGQTARRSGSGSRLLEAVAVWAQRHGARTLLLEVRSANVGAQAFYAAWSFVSAGLRRGYYKAPADDAVMMRLNLPAR